MIELYQFPISHYCEKIRWALDYKKLDHHTRNLLPGLHAKVTTKLVGQSAVPVLADGGQAIKDSATIITYLDDKYPAHCLTPADKNLREEALEWERYADQEIGPYVRCLCYHTLLDHPEIVIPFFAQDGSWYSKALLKIIFPKLQGKMRKFMQINIQSAQASKGRLDVAIEKIHQFRSNKDFMVGDSFTRADLALASMLAPLCMPHGYGLSWPNSYPEPLATSLASWDGKLDWVTEVYSKYRP